MRFHADLHVHSRHSRATSRDLDLEHLAHWAARKGIGVVATGDFTHPVWRAELKDKLVPAEPGLFRLRPDIEDAIAATLPAACRTPVRFMLEVEISTIYKKGERTRKIHHLIYAPDFATADRCSDKLARIGNIASDGRPILGLDSRDLLEITLESGPDAYLVPAHIWTPWFAALGSQSGFDSIAQCYGDLAPHIFAIETGLSSDPPMNWRVSFLDRYRLTSNSDAHSPGKLGREATTFDCELDYFALKRALETGQGYVGTVEFFPDEGKYHLDGHRKCGVRLSPSETLKNGGRCPVCGEPVTIGVEHRVETLADRSEAEATPPATAGEVSNLVPLPEILSELAAAGRASKAVEQSYNRAIAALGPELVILQTMPVEDIGRASSSLLAEAITRLRAGKVIREPGYDGEYGVIRLFEDDEIKRMAGGGWLFDPPAARKQRAKLPSSSASRVQSPHSAMGDGAEPAPLPPCSEAERRGGAGGGGILCHMQDPPTPAPSAPTLPAARQSARGGGGPRQCRPVDSNSPDGCMPGILSQLDDGQRVAAQTVDGALLIVAGPGSGKTRTLTHRIAHLVAERGVPARNCLAITFTRRAAAEMRERLAQLLPARADEIAIHTFHSLGLMILREHANAAGLQRGFHVASEAERIALLTETLGITAHRAKRLLRAISKEKRAGTAGADIAEAMAAYGRAMMLRNWIDFDDLVALAVRGLTSEPGLAALYQDRFRFVSVDEFQDVDEQQYRLLKLMAPPGANLCVIGDPDQAIYGFRGADASCFERFKADHPTAGLVTLRHNYRSTGTIVAASAQVIAGNAGGALVGIVRDMHERITIHVAPTERAEAESVVAGIEEMIGGASFFSLDSGRANGTTRNLSFADFAVLYRTEAQSAALCEAFARSGMPFKTNSHGALADAPAVQALLSKMAEGGAADDRPLEGLLRAAASQLRACSGCLDLAQIEMACMRLATLAERCGGDHARLRDAVAIATDADFFDPRADRVSLLTLHASKGLEFPVVFIVGLEDGLLPLSFGQPDDAAITEERRLLYVGMTRAKDRLVLSRARQRFWRGRLRTLDASPFLTDIESELLKHQRSRLPRKPQERQLSLL